MKKLLTLLLAVGFSLAFVACGGNTAKEEATTTEAVEETAEEAVEEMEEATEEVIEEADSAATEVEEAVEEGAAE